MILNYFFRQSKPNEQWPKCAVATSKATNFKLTMPHMNSALLSLNNVGILAWTWRRGQNRGKLSSLHTRPQRSLQPQRRQQTIQIVLTHRRTISKSFLWGSTSKLCWGVQLKSGLKSGEKVQLGETASRMVCLKGSNHRFYINLVGTLFYF